MPINTALLPRVELRREKVTVHDFQSEANPQGVAFEFDFALPERIGAAEEFLLGDRRAELVKKYIDDNVPLLAPGGYRLPLSPSLCYWITRLMWAEEGAGSLNTTPFQDWALFAVQAPRAWNELMLWFSRREREMHGLPSEPIIPDGGTLEQVEAEEAEAMEAAPVSGNV